MAAPTVAPPLIDEVFCEDLYLLSMAVKLVSSSSGLFGGGWLIIAGGWGCRVEKFLASKRARPADLGLWSEEMKWLWCWRKIGEGERESYRSLVFSLD